MSVTRLRLNWKFAPTDQARRSMFRAWTLSVSSIPRFRILPTFSCCVPRPVTGCRGTWKRASVVRASYHVKFSPTRLDSSAASKPASIVEVRSGRSCALPGFANRGADSSRNGVAEKVRSLRKAPGNLPVWP